MTETLYEILGVKQNATKEEIKLAYRKLVRKFHPDVSQEKGSVERFKKITDAMKTLTDDVERLKYDTSMGVKRTSSPPPSARRSEQEFFKQKAKKDAKGEQEGRGEGAFSKIFHEFFDEKKAQGAYSRANEAKAQGAYEKNHTHAEHNESKAQKERGEDIYTTITITPEEALKGAARKINIVHSEPCVKCGGRKFINGAKCTLCDGVGEKTVHKKLTIKIPPNIKDGTKIRVANEGKAGKQGGKNGDLYLNVTIVKENSIFEVSGNEVTCSVPIAPWEAVLGANIQVPTPEGSVLMKIPPSTPSGQRFKLVNNGIANPKTGKRGDLIVIVNIETPKNLTEQELELYEKLKILDIRNIRKELFAT